MNATLSENADELNAVSAPNFGLKDGLPSSFCGRRASPQLFELAGSSGAAVQKGALVIDLRSTSSTLVHVFISGK